MRIDVGAEDEDLLQRLKGYVDEAEYANDDGPAVRSIRKLADLLVDVEERAASDEEGDSIIAAKSKGAREGRAASEGVDVVEKENPRLSVGSAKSTKSTGGEKRASHRTRLAVVNCN